jgi:abortive infection Abi-like protein
VARRTNPAELITRAIRLAVIETLAARYFTPEIDRLFESEGWEIDLDGLDRYEDMPQGRAEAFDRAVDFTLPGDAEAYLVVVGHMLARMTQGEADEDWDNKKAPYRTARERIERELRRGGCAPDDEGVWHLPGRVEPSAALLEAGEGTGIARITAAMRRPDCDPEERIGLAKELVEAVIKFALTKLGEPYGKTDDIPALAKKLHKALGLDPKLSLTPDPQGDVTARRLLAGLTAIPHNLAELRNPYGSGHGRAERIAGITLLADLAARAADAYATFIVGVLDERLSE